jgi:hypothetical protein
VECPRTVYTDLNKLWFLASFDTAGEVLRALVGCLGVEKVSCIDVEVSHASPDADWTHPT